MKLTVSKLTVSFLTATVRDISYNMEFTVLVAFWILVSIQKFHAFSKLHEANSKLHETNFQTRR